MATKSVHGEHIMNMILCRLQATRSYVSKPVMRMTSSVAFPALEAMIDQPLLRETPASDRPLPSRRSAKCADNSMIPKGL
jgi:hypothetical protein